MRKLVIGLFALGTVGWAAAQVATQAPEPSRLGLPPLLTPADNPGSPAKVDLGRQLFFDKRLSADGRVACATCHDPAQQFTDGRKVAVGNGGQAGSRNAPSLLNAALQTSQFWDGRRPTLEAQALDPLLNPVEHGLADRAQLERLVAADGGYAQMFSAAFGAQAPAVSAEHVAQALASYERTLLAGGTPFDRYEYGGDRNALSEPARRGLELFRGRARCASCHLIGRDNAPLTDNDFHSVGISLQRLAGRVAAATLRVARAPGAEVDRLVITDPDVAELGRFVQTRDPRDIGKFRTPALRDAARTAPYMHDGSVATLADAIDVEVYYRTLESGEPLILTPREREELIAFIRDGLAVANDTRH